MINSEKRPYVICHMTMSVDGKVTGDWLSSPEMEPAVELYYEMNRNYKADAFACGRVTMEESFTEGWEADLGPFENVSMSGGECLENAMVSRMDYVADENAKFFAVAFDRNGRLGWKTSRIEDDDPGYGGAHIIEVLCENVSDAYLAYLRSIGVSYIFAGTNEMNLELALEKLYEIFGIKKLLLEGGSIFNAAFEKERLIDELSLVVAPILVGLPEEKPLFYEMDIAEYDQVDVEKYEGVATWFRYLKRK